MAKGSDSEPITELLIAWNRGDTRARDKLFPLIYDELRRLASRALRGERRDHVLQATALVHEAFLRLVSGGAPNWESRKHFFAIASRIMRQVLVDQARIHLAKKRGARAQHVSLDDALVISPRKDSGLILLDDALNDLAAIDEAKCRLVELHFFGGLSLQETADVLTVPVSRVKRDWSLARAWLYRHMRGQDRVSFAGE